MLAEMVFLQYLWSIIIEDHFIIDVDNEDRVFSV